MPIVPDGKDWTWVLGRPCPECGIEASTIDPTSVAALARSNAESWERALAAPTAGTRSNPEVWSPLEYGCHVRDVHRIYQQRLELMLAETDPLFANWDQDETAVAEAYTDQDPSVVADELGAAASSAARVFDTVTGKQWERTGRRSDGATFTVATLARYYAHDWLHHLHDVGGGA